MPVVAAPGLRRRHIVPVWLMLAIAALPIRAGVLLDENFDGLVSALQPAAEETIPPGILGWTHQAPEGWRLDNTRMAPRQGVREWQGWSFTTSDFWTRNRSRPGA